MYAAIVSMCYAEAMAATRIGAVDIGGTKIAAGIIDSEGRMLARRVCPTDPRLGWEAALDRTAAMLKEAAGEAGGGFEGIGIGCTGPVDPATGCIGTADLLPGWLGSPVVARLSSEFGISAALENDADSAALAEARWGLGKGAECFVYVTISTGIGAGVVHRGLLYRGAGGGHQELGHLAVDSSGPRCYCGLDGCWEALASGTAMEAWYAAQPDSPGPAGAADICAAAKRGEPLAGRAVEREAWYIAAGLVNVATAFCPDVIALGGGVMQSAPLFLDRVRALVRSRVTQVPVDRLLIDVAALGADAGLKGAACAWLHRFGDPEGLQRTQNSKNT
jgi:glucokinase